MIGFHEVIDEVSVEYGLDNAGQEWGHQDVLPVENPNLPNIYQWKM